MRRKGGDLVTFSHAAREDVWRKTLKAFEKGQQLTGHLDGLSIWRRTLHGLLMWGVGKFGAEAVALAVRQVMANVGNEVMR